jgi:hypothetical protein
VFFSERGPDSRCGEVEVPERDARVDDRGSAGAGVLIGVFELEKINGKLKYPQTGKHVENRYNSISYLQKLVCRVVNK